MILYLKKNGTGDLTPQFFFLLGNVEFSRFSSNTALM
nr:MAG TPA_asm: hypothetical protein [Bacteriophage sp.]